MAETSLIGTTASISLQKNRDRPICFQRIFISNTKYKNNIHITGNLDISVCVVANETDSIEAASLGCGHHANDLLVWRVTIGP